MRYLMLLFSILIFGCVAQECPPCECPEPGEKIIYVNETEEIACTSANITINTVIVNQTCDSNETNVTEYAEPEGIEFADRKYVLVLDDVSYPTSSKGSCGIFSVKYRENSSIIDRLIICPGYSKTWLSPEGHSYRMKVIEVAAGYTKDVKWAEVQIFG